MNAPDVADYLANNPEFFEQYADLLSSVNLAHPHGNRAISLSERQIMALREKNKALEMRLADLLRHGKENEVILDKLLRFTRALLLQRNARALPDILQQCIAEIFVMPEIGLRIWDTADEYADLPAAGPVSVDLISLANQLSAPAVGPALPPWRDAAALLDAASVQSMALIALRRGAEPQAFGILVLGSPDPKRFHVGMGVEVLGHLGEAASAALTRLVG